MRRKLVSQGHSTLTISLPSRWVKQFTLKGGDEVEVEGEYLKFLGRKSEIINVGGEKVYPAEVESVIQEIDNVAEVVVYKERNPITGNIVCAEIRPRQPDDSKKLAREIKTYCSQRLENFKIPVKVKITDQNQYTTRLKKARGRFV